MKTTIQKYKYLHLYRLSVLHILTVTEWKSSTDHWRHWQQIKIYLVTQTLPCVPGKERPLWLAFLVTSCAGDSEQNLQAPTGWFHLGNTQSHKLLFWLWPLVWGETAFHFSCFWTGKDFEKGTIDSMSTFKKLIMGRNPWHHEWIFQYHKRQQGSISFYASQNKYINSKS